MSPRRPVRSFKRRRRARRRCAKTPCARPSGDARAGAWICSPVVEPSRCPLARHARGAGGRGRTVRCSPRWRRGGVTLTGLKQMTARSAAISSVSPLTADEIGGLRRRRDRPAARRAPRAGGRACRSSGVPRDRALSPATPVTFRARRGDAGRRMATAIGIDCASWTSSAGRRMSRSVARISSRQTAACTRVCSFPLTGHRDRLGCVQRERGEADGRIGAIFLHCRPWSAGRLGRCTLIRSSRRTTARRSRSVIRGRRTRATFS